MACVLVVDDEPDLRFLHRRVLERAGHQVIEAGDGAAAWQKVREVEPDLVLTDIMMPVMNGVELIERIRGDPETASIPIICVSGDWQLAVDADVVLAKPVNGKNLLAQAEALLQKGRSSR